MTLCGVCIELVSFLCCTLHTFFFFEKGFLSSLELAKLARPAVQ